MRTLAIALVTVVLAAAPALAITAQEKMETCKVGAESQQLEGAKRSTCIKKCMAQGNYEPVDRKNEKKMTAPAPKPQ